MIKIKYIISRIILIILPLLYSANTFAQIKITVPVLTISDNRVEKILLKEFLEIGPHLKDHVIILDFDKSTSVLNVLYFNKKSFNELLMNEEGNFAGISNFKCLIGVKLGAKNFFKLSDPIKNESFCVTQNLEKNTELIKFVEPFDVYRTDYKISKDGFRLLKRNMKFDN
ncbi:hypothetical protein [Sphingobacterium faecium]|uniref:hypothetical protein n=1 Tax=Sphingobacterium faecium TaxID=34087 RepID=UPI002468F26C|nr:hypothetical protein [Sphingobacterium faecium]MDH5826435.1 hypothetical protein [Sphingobacterium faecium]